MMYQGSDHLHARKVLKWDNFFKKIQKDSKKYQATTSVKEICVYHFCLKKDLRHLDGDDLYNFIDNDLQSDLKEYVIQRSFYIILESKNYYNINEKAKNEIKRLHKYLSKNQIFKFMEYCYRCPHTGSCNDSITNSNLRDLFAKRNEFRNDETKFNLIEYDILEEWRKLCNFVPKQCVLLYASDVLKTLK